MSYVRIYILWFNCTWSSMDVVILIPPSVWSLSGWWEFSRILLTSMTTLTSCWTLCCYYRRPITVHCSHGLSMLIIWMVINYTPSMVGHRQTILANDRCGASKMFSGHSSSVNVVKKPSRPSSSFYIRTIYWQFQANDSCTIRISKIKSQVSC